MTMEWERCLKWLLTQYVVPCYPTLPPTARPGATRPILRSPRIRSAYAPLNTAPCARCMYTPQWLSARATLRTPACTHELAQCALRTYRPRRRKGALEQRAARAWVGSLRTGSSSAHVFTIHVILLVLEFTLRKTISGPPAGASATDESHRL
ncbi:hypothetical protein C8R45DRAFT_1192335 [Mycena sanguinolenta]|nr:hypothetical protein C8R45DRAFT_1192335 [Mycena sanguinolenta]